MASASGIRAGAAFVEITAHDTKLRRGLERASARLKAFGAGVAASGMQFIKWGGLLTAALLGAAKVFGKMGDDIAKMSKRTGVAVETLSELEFAAGRSGSSMENIEKAIRTMQRSIFDLGLGLSTSVDAFDALGLTLQQIQGMSPAEQFDAVTNALAGIEDPTKRAAVAMKVFGRAGTSLIPMLGDMKALREEARRLGLVMSAEDAAAAEEFQDAMGDLWSVVKRGVFHIGAGLAPILTDLGNKMSEVISKTNGWINENKGLIVVVLQASVGALAFGAALVVLGKAIALVGFAAKIAAVGVSLLSGAIGVLGGVIAFLTSPIGLIVAALVGLTAYVLTATGAMGKAASWLGEKWKRLGELAGKVFKGITDAFASGDLKLAAEILWVGLEIAWIQGTENLYLIWNTFWVDMKLLLTVTGGDLVSMSVKIWHAFGKEVENATSIAEKAIVHLIGAYSRLASAKGWVFGQISYAEYEQSLKDISQLTKDTLAGVDSSYAQRIKQIDANTNELLAHNQAATDTLLVSIVKGNDAVLAERARLLLKLQAELDTLLSLAAAKRKQAEDEAAGAGIPGAGPGAPPPPPPGAGAGKVAKSAVFGTFSGAIASRIGPGKVFSKIADAAEETAQNTKGIWDNMKDEKTLSG